MQMHILLLILILITGVWAIILLVDRYFDLESHGLDVGPGILLWRTKYGLNALDRISGAWSGGWRFFGIFGMGVGVIFMIAVFVFLILNTILLFTIGAPPGMGGAGVKLAVPGMTIPLLLGVIGFASVLLVHEPAHGIMARRVGLPVKSTGLLLFAVIPGAFVEPDEERLKKASISDRLQVYGAGSFANILFGLLCFGIILALITPLSGLYISGVGENTPAENVGLQPRMHIMGIGYEEDNLITIDNYQVFADFMDNTRPEENILLYTEKTRYNITLENKDNQGYIGIWLTASTSRSSLIHPLSIYGVAVFEILGRPIINQYAYDAAVPWLLIEVLKWMFTLNILVGLFNLLPLKPLDGGHIAEGLTEKVVSKRTANVIANALSVATLAILLMNFAPIFV
ncbi:hypothetical protein AKJ48_03200 [candidate division MSBL1 archaeon SCGC-AAA261O19]|uniref:Peptidase M50 domain-containing protein n=1 Tax=candidate division MSBL1 archaeon SCGC-AAA261O19 TaxID=1698277 RepID=A0A133VCV4_9EURY|nr:hypothetical protein AKJ48_03200 [candidate division MSBL1 archaeon SCGC-AAA261O19]